MGAVDRIGRVRIRVVPRFANRPLGLTGIKGAAKTSRMGS